MTELATESPNLVVDEVTEAAAQVAATQALDSSVDTEISEPQLSDIVVEDVAEQTTEAVNPAVTIVEEGTIGADGSSEIVNFTNDPEGIESDIEVDTVVDETAVDSISDETTGIVSSDPIPIINADPTTELIEIVENKAIDDDVGSSTPDIVELSSVDIEDSNLLEPVADQQPISIEVETDVSPPAEISDASDVNNAVELIEPAVLNNVEAEIEVHSTASSNDDIQDIDDVTPDEVLDDDSKNIRILKLSAEKIELTTDDAQDFDDTLTLKILEIQPQDIETIDDDVRSLVAENSEIERPIAHITELENDDVEVQVTDTEDTLPIDDNPMFTETDPISIAGEEEVEISPEVNPQEIEDADVEQAMEQTIVEDVANEPQVVEVEIVEEILDTPEVEPKIEDTNIDDIIEQTIEETVAPERQIEEEGSVQEIVDTLETIEPQIEPTEIEKAVEIMIDEIIESEPQDIELVNEEGDTQVIEQINTVAEPQEIEAIEVEQVITESEPQEIEVSHLVTFPEKAEPVNTIQNNIIQPEIVEDDNSQKEIVRDTQSEHIQDETELLDEAAIMFLEFEPQRIQTIEEITSAETESPNTDSVQALTALSTEEATPIEQVFSLEPVEILELEQNDATLGDTLEVSPIKNELQQTKLEVPFGAKISNSDDNEEVKNEASFGGTNVNDGEASVANIDPHVQPAVVMFSRPKADISFTFSPSTKGDTSSDSQAENAQGNSDTFGDIVIKPVEFISINRIVSQNEVLSEDLFVRTLDTSKESDIDADDLAIQAMILSLPPPAPDSAPPSFINFGTENDNDATASSPLSSELSDTIQRANINTNQETTDDAALADNIQSSSQLTSDNSDTGATLQAAVAIPISTAEEDSSNVQSIVVSSGQEEERPTQVRVSQLEVVKEVHETELPDTLFIVLPETIAEEPSRPASTSQLVAVNEVTEIEHPAEDPTETIDTDDDQGLSSTGPDLDTESVLAPSTGFVAELQPIREVIDTTVTEVS